jgi:hypothetical protein
MPILTKQAVKGAGLEKNCEIFIAPLLSSCMRKLGITRPCPPRTHPTGHTICGERVVIAGKVPFVRAPSF